MSEYNEETTPILAVHLKKTPIKSSSILFCLLGFFGNFNLYCLKVNMSVALVAMIKDSHRDDKILQSDCPSPSQNMSEKFVKNGDYYWSSEMQGHILGAFFYGYCITHFPAGILSERFGGKCIYGLGVCITAFLTLLTPLAAEFSPIALIILRILEGCAEGVTSPTMHYLIAKRISKYQRSAATNFIYSGSQIGAVVSLPISGLLCNSDFLGGWPSVFYIFGFSGCIWTVFWFILITDEKAPNNLMNRFGEMEFRNSSVPWLQIFKSREVWILIITHFGQNWGFLLLLTELPTYMSTVLHFDIKQNGFLSALPYLFQSLTGWLCGFITDFIYRNGYAEINVIRKTCNTIGFFGTAFCLIGVIQAGCDHILSVILFNLAMFFNGFVNSGYFVSIIDMSPDFSGILLGISSTFASTPGFLAPAFVGYITKYEQTVRKWSIIFYSTAGLYIITNIIYVIYGSAKLQPWGIAKSENSNNSETNSIIPVNMKTEAIIYR